MMKTCQLTAERVCDTLCVWHLGDVVRKLREARGWTLAEMTRRTGLDKGTLSRLENHPERATLATRQTVAKALCTTLEEMEALIPPGPLREDELDCLKRYRGLSEDGRRWFRETLERAASALGNLSFRPNTAEDPDHGDRAN